MARTLHPAWSTAPGLALLGVAGLHLGGCLGSLPGEAAVWIALAAGMGCAALGTTQLPIPHTSWGCALLCALILGWAKSPQRPSFLPEQSAPVAFQGTVLQRHPDAEGGWTGLIRLDSSRAGTPVEVKDLSYHSTSKPLLGKVQATGVLQRFGTQDRLLGLRTHALGIAGTRL